MFVSNKIASSLINNTVIKQLRKINAINLITEKSLQLI